MDTQQVSAPSRAPSRLRGRVTGSGVRHVRARHTDRFTVVGNHLAQHAELSLTAIGLAVHIQSLPDGAKVGIKVLTDRFPESEGRIAAALRELEEHRYLERTLVRLPGGELVTRTVAYDHPGAAPATLPPAPPPPEPEPEPEPEPAPAPAPAPVPQRAPAPPRPPLPQPQAPDLERHRLAAGILAGLRRDDARLLLGEQDIRRLAPAVAAWLERDAHPDAVRHALTADLPDRLRQPAGLLAHRLTALLPPPLPTAPPKSTRDPFQTCDSCERAFRAPEPGRCRDCRSDLPEAA
ncbi:helix-turn-helix domain-containing protein [Streptomyces sp. WAC05374]|uniref:helix-turn-helix domain-containing protein n=1 Tax=Streptomyces sp. WAC05374 TaxID=2487420 RepID=UPI000F86A9A3|nr:helix-turn-helix domain-containing protein [Streptomyces sp. WAC05374]RST13760.1 helix-turn-helix domain-containing protein [Streptomyces sp. WAC05374]TDF46948.1 helix-turn-helix domain-containing protein [Streptomyces sp. WAC05374]TDF57204.1 helix-turn-helix domain-containing protein [Streptomyces sp. WAC05374]TDF61307.1 helix-turn-helix domain-containing protein [Streptomyces sp. WAC05374]